MRAPTVGFKLFYGWVVVGAGFVVLFAAYGTQFTFGVFLPEFEGEFGWSRAQITLPFSIYVASYTLLSGVTGLLTDRYGPRVVLLGGAVFLGTAIFLLGRVTELWHLYVLYPLVAAAGMSTTVVPCNATLVRWFVRLRGTAMGVMSSGNGIGTTLVPFLVGLLILGLGWRDAYYVLGPAVMVVIMAAALLMVRDPGRRGLHPDGDPEEGPRPPEAQARETPWRVGEAARTQAFWLLALVMVFNFLFLFIPTVHLAAYAQGLGISPGRAVLAISAVGLGQALGRLSMGALSDHLGRRRTAGLTLGIQTACFVGLAFIPAAPAVYVLGFLLGLGQGGFNSLWSPLVADLFGRRSAGALIGLIFSIAGPTTAAGPYLAGVVYDAFESYYWAFMMGAMGNLVALLLLACLRPPRRPAPRAAG